MPPKPPKSGKAAKPDPTTFRARRRKELEDSKRKAKEDAAAILQNEKIKANVVRQVKRMQAISRGFLARLFHVPRHKEEHKHLKQWSLQNIFNYYTIRQSELETRKERIFYSAKDDVDKWTALFNSADNISALDAYLKESGVQTRLDSRMSFENAKDYCCKKILNRAIQSCEKVNVEFRRVYKKFKSGRPLARNFVYFSKAISFSYLIIMLRDFKLLKNGVTHGEISRLFKKYAVRIEEEREKVRAKFSYRHMSETHDEVFTPVIINDCLKNLGCNHSTMTAAEELLNGETHLSERDFLKFWQKHIGDGLELANATASKDKSKKKKKAQKSSLLDLGLKLAGLKAILYEITPKVYPPSPSCRCAACRKKKLPPRSTAHDVHSKYALNMVHRYHIAPLVHHTEDSGLCSGHTVLGRNILNFEDHVRWWLRFENNLKSLFVYYGSQAWDLAINQRKNWDDAVSEDMQINYSNFIRFASDFGIYPKYLGNDKYSKFELLHSFLSASQGSRTDPFHKCSFTSYLAVGEGRHKIGHISSKYCIHCGEQQYVLSQHTEEKLEQEFDLYADEDGYVFVHNVGEIFHHAGESPLPAQEYLAEHILNEASSIKKMYMHYNEDNDTSSNREGKCINRGQFLFAIEQSRRLRNQILHGTLTFPEFIHALSLCATNSFKFKKFPQEWEFPMQEIFKVMDPTFRVKFGRAIETEVNETAQKDPLIDSVKLQFRSMLETLYAKYQFLEDGINVQGMSSDVFVLFVQDSRLFKKITYDQAINMFKATLKRSSSRRLNFDEFCTAAEGLLFENFCLQKSSPAPLSYFEPIGPGTGITNHGLTLRNAITKLKILYEQYNPMGRSTAIAPKDGPNMVRKSPDKTMSPINKKKKKFNRAGSFLRMAGQKSKQSGNMAKNRLKRAIRQKNWKLNEAVEIRFWL